MTTLLTKSPAVLSTGVPEAQFALGDMLLIYSLDLKTLTVGLTCVPCERQAHRVAKRQFLDEPEVTKLPERWLPVAAGRVDSLVQCSVRGRGGPDAFASGLTMRNGPTVTSLHFESQRYEEHASEISIITRLVDQQSEFACEHRVRWCHGELFVRVDSRFENTSGRPLTLEMLASFSLGGITPFHPADAPGRLRVHRILSAWSSEGRLESKAVEELNLERSWIGHGVRALRFGQVGSMPVRGYWPFLAVEDHAAGVLWGATLAVASSWQMELYRRGDDLAFSGGLADREFGHWWKTVPAGSSFDAPQAVISTVAGDLDDLCHRLTSAQDAAADLAPANEADLPAVFNEWCSSWGNPTHDNVLAAAKALDPTLVRYVVIDDGWVERPTAASQFNGDWNPNQTAFPRGLKATCDELRRMGFVPGIWFEFEVCTQGTQAFLQAAHHLHQDGIPLQLGPRRFWDFRDPFTHEYLAGKVIDLLKNGGFGCLKVDYNEAIGIGCDGAESPGEGLRQHIEGVQRFFAALRESLPELVIENCSSGGHRLEPSMMALTSMGSFSDAHESAEIPIIAANVHRVILPRQSQIWAVLRRDDSVQRLRYSLSATFLGRMCLSGEISQLDGEQLREVRIAQQFYQAAAPIIRRGKSRRFGSLGHSYRHPTGRQTVIRTASDGRSALLVEHTFAGALSEAVAVPLPDGAWTVDVYYNLAPSEIELARNQIILAPAPAFTGRALILRRIPDSTRRNTEGHPT